MIKLSCRCEVLQVEAKVTSRAVWMLRARVVYTVRWRVLENLTFCRFQILDLDLHRDKEGSGCFG